MEKKIKSSGEVKKIAIIGPESSGKTTLTRSLAEYYDTLWVKEFARHYLEVNGSKYTFEDLIPIAEGQLEWEKTTEAQAEKPFIFCDTNLSVILVWAEYVFNKQPEKLRKLFKPEDYILHVLCTPDIPWVADPLREHPEEREEIFKLYVNLMDKLKIPYLITSGSEEERRNTVIQWIANNL